MPPKCATLLPILIKMELTRGFRITFFLVLVSASFSGMAQELYSAQGYWNEINKEGYPQILVKKQKGDSLTTNESLYLQDYEGYLANYFQRMPQGEKKKYEQMKAKWELEKTEQRSEKIYFYPGGCRCHHFLNQDFCWIGIYCDGGII